MCSNPRTSYLGTAKIEVVAVQVRKNSQSTVSVSLCFNVLNIGSTEVQDLQVPERVAVAKGESCQPFDASVAQVQMVQVDSHVTHRGNRGDGSVRQVQDPQFTV